TCQPEPWPHLWDRKPFSSAAGERFASGHHRAASRPRRIRIHVRNVGAGHSVPTGSNRRAIYLKVDVLDQGGTSVASPEWMFAPNFADRPDDKAFVQADKTGPETVAATQADAQGPHEPPVRAGEDRVLTWETQPLNSPPGWRTIQTPFTWLVSIQ